MTNVHNRVLYTGVTSNLQRRAYEHRQGCGSEFTSKYRVHKLVYYEVYADAYTAISREKQIKAGPRRKKIELVEHMNPDWRDLYDEL
jgi:putative endonuclease